MESNSACNRTCDLKNTREPDLFNHERDYKDTKLWLLSINRKQNRFMSNVGVERNVQSALYSRSFTWDKTAMLESEWRTGRRQTKDMWILNDVSSLIVFSQYIIFSPAWQFCTMATRVTGGKWPIDPEIRAVDLVIRLNLVTPMISSLTFVPVHFAVQVVYDWDQPSDSQFISNVHNFDVFCSSTATPPNKA